MVEAWYFDYLGGLVMTEKYLSIQEIESQLHIPNTTIRRYIKLFREHIEIIKKGNQYFVSENSLLVLERIRELYNEGKIQHEIDVILNRGKSVVDEHCPRGKSVVDNDEAMSLLNSIEKKQAELITELIKHNKRIVDSKDQTITMLTKQLEYERERNKQLEAILFSRNEVSAARGIPGETLVVKKSPGKKMRRFILTVITIFLLIILIR